MTNQPLDLNERPFPRLGGCNTRPTHGADMADALATVLHEYAHLAVPGREHHGPRHKVMLARAACEITGLTLDTQDVQSWTYPMLQRAVEDHVRVWWHEKGLDKLWALAEDR